MNLFDIFESNEQELDEDLRKWFKDKWVRFGPDGEIRGDCARGDDSEGKPKCLPQSKAQSLGKKGRASAAARKRREDPNPERSGKAINVATKKKSNEGVAEGLVERGGYQPSTEPDTPEQAARRQQSLQAYQAQQQAPKPPIPDGEYQRRLQQYKIGGRGAGWGFQPKPEDAAAAEAERAKLFGPKTTQQSGTKVDEQGVAEGNDDHIWGPQGNFAGDRIVNLGGVTMKTVEVGDTVKYFGQKAKVVAMSKDRKHSRINILSDFGGTTRDVLTSDLKQLGQGVAEAFGPLPRDNQQIRLGRHTVNIERVGEDKDYFSFAWHDSQGQEHYQEVPVGDLGSYDDLIDRIKDEIRYQERQYTDQGVAEGVNDTVYPNATVIKSKNGRPVGEIYQDGNSWGCFHYRADRGYDMIDTREDAIEALKDLHQETGRSRPDYTIKGVAEEQLDEKCWDTHKQVGMKKKGNRMVPNCVPKESIEEMAGKTNPDAVRRIQQLLNKKFDANLDIDGILGPLTLKSIKKFLPKSTEKQAPNPEKTTAVQGKQVKEEKCPHCGGEMVSEELINEKKDSCYYKVKSRYKVWPSAYASGALVKCRKKGAKNWGNKSEGVAEDRVDEKWSQKYKDSINCSNPKGFSQKAHCAGEKKNEDMAEGKEYYTVTGTDSVSLRRDFNMAKDRNGWYLREGATPKQKLEAFRAFGSPKLKEFNLAAFSGGTQTKGDDNVISPVGSQTRAQYKK